MHLILLQTLCDNPKTSYCSAQCSFYRHGELHAEGLARRRPGTTRRTSHGVQGQGQPDGGEFLSFFAPFLRFVFLCSFSFSFFLFLFLFLFLFSFSLPYRLHPQITWLHAGRLRQTNRLSQQVRKHIHTLVATPFYQRIIISPRQARDKHGTIRERSSTPKDRPNLNCVRVQCHDHIIHDGVLYTYMLCCVILHCIVSAGVSPRILRTISRGRASTKRDGTCKSIY
eukprot:COSAG06_NODE_16722_length_984_cov_9.465537_1_plen_225_part_01